MEREGKKVEGKEGKRRGEKERRKERAGIQEITVLHLGGKDG